MGRYCRIVAFALPRAQMNEPPLVRIAANCVRRLIYQYRDDLVAGMIVAGWDKKLGGQVRTHTRDEHDDVITVGHRLGLFVPTRWLANSTTSDPRRLGQYLYMGLLGQQLPPEHDQTRMLRFRTQRSVESTG